MGAARAEGYVYWGNTWDHAIGRAALDGTGVDQHFLSLPDDVQGTGALRGLALDESHVFWSHGSTSAGAIGRVELGGADLDPDFVTTAGSPTGLATDATHLYWAAGTNGLDPSSGAVGRADLDGTHADDAFVTKAAWTINGVAVDADHLYWANDSGHQTIGRANLDGTGADQAFISSPWPPGAVAVDGTYVYWSTGSAIGRAKLDASEVNTTFINATAYGIAVDQGHIYWAGGSFIGRAGLDGSQVEQPWINGANGAWVVAVDDRAATTMTLVPSRAHAVYGNDLAFTAHVAAQGGGAPTGRVTFEITGAPAASVAVAGDGSATFDPPYLLDVGDTVTASYSGDAHHGPSDADLAVDLRPAKTSMTAALDPVQATPGTNVTFTVAVHNDETDIMPFGAIYFFIDGTSVAAAAPDENGELAMAFTPLKPGDLHIRALYHDSTGLPPDFVDSEQTRVLHVVAAAPAAGPPVVPASAPPPPAPAVVVKPARCTVPRLKGLTLTAGKRRLRKARCRLGTVTHKRAGRAHRNRILASTPRAGRSTIGKVRLIVGR